MTTKERDNDEKAEGSWRRDEFLLSPVLPAIEDEQESEEVNNEVRDEKEEEEQRFFFLACETSASFPSSVLLPHM